MFFTNVNGTARRAVQSGKSQIVKRASIAISVLAVLCLLLLPLGAAAQTSTTAMLLVKLVSGLTTDQIAQVIARNGGTEISSIPALRLHVIAVDAASLDAVRARVVYDNQMGQSDTGSAATTLGGGSIQIKTK